MIKPSLGRIVWFTPYAGDGLAVGNGGRCAAIVTYVHSDRLVNLTVFDANGVPAPKTSIKLVQEGDPRPAAGFCEWMPYQLQAAAREQASAAGT